MAKKKKLDDVIEPEDKPVSDIKEAVDENIIEYINKTDKTILIRGDVTKIGATHWRRVKPGKTIELDKTRIHDAKRAGLSRK